MSRCFALMREVIGQEECCPEEIAVNDMLLSWLREDDLIWVPPRDMPVPTEAVSQWTNGLMLDSCALRYEMTGDERWLSFAKRLFAGLSALVTWQDGMAHYPHFATNLKDENYENNMGPTAFPSYVLNYWRVARDPEALQLAVALSEGLVNGVENARLGETDRFHEDGSYMGHVHCHTRCMRGVIMTGLLTGNTRYIEWGKRVYDFTKQYYGTDTGWFAEWIDMPRDDKGDENDGETCITADMAGAAADLAMAGHTECFDDMERFVRNYMIWAQFFVTPSHEEEYRRRHGDAADEGLAAVRLLEGTFLASPDANDLCSSHHNDMHMAACCIASSGLVLWNAWKHVVTEDDRGLFVNMCLDRSTPELDIMSGLPDRGRITVRVKKDPDRTVHIRPPSWAPRELITTSRGGRECPADWRWDGYVGFDESEPGEELVMSFPLIRFRQEASLKKISPASISTYTQEWIGNTIVDITPRGNVLPMFNGPALERPPCPESVS